jgi:hypothetical protein
MAGQAQRPPLIPRPTQMPTHTKRAVCGIYHSLVGKDPPPRACLQRMRKVNTLPAIFIPFPVSSKAHSFLSSPQIRPYFAIILHKCALAGK